MGPERHAAHVLRLNVIIDPTPLSNCIANHRPSRIPAGISMNVTKMNSGTSVSTRECGNITM